MKTSHLVTVLLLAFMLAGLSSAQDAFDDEPVPPEAQPVFVLDPAPGLDRDPGDDRFDAGTLPAPRRSDDFDALPTDDPNAVDDVRRGVSEQSEFREAPIEVERRLPDGRVVRENYERSQALSAGSFREFPAGTEPTPSFDPFGQENSHPQSLAPEVAQKLSRAFRAVTQYTDQLKRVAASDRPAVAKELEAALRRLFDVRTEIRESQVADLERRIQQLRTQLHKRVDKKEEIVRLRLQTLVNEANGLTF